MKKLFARPTALALALMLSAGFAATATAGTTSGDLGVSASVSASCKIDSTTAIAFGSYDPAAVNAASGADLQGSGAVAVVCTKGGVVSVTLDEGANKTAATSSCITPARNMKSTAGDLMAYNIYSDSSRSVTWGCDTTNQVQFTSVGAAAPTVLDAYGSVPKGQDVPAGNYVDSVTAVVTF
jgi:spore coat protein U-like protein